MPLRRSRAAPSLQRGADRDVRLLLAYSFVVSFQLWMALWIAYLTEFRGISLALVGLLETFFQAVNVFGVVPAGALADRFGRRRALALGTLIEGVGLTIFAFAGNLPLLVLSYLLWASGGTIRDPASSAFMYDALAARGRAEDFAKYYGRYTALMSVGFMVAGILGGLLAQVTSLQVPVMLSAASYSTALVLVLLMREPPRATSSVDRMSYVRTVAEGVQVLRRDRPIRFLVLLNLGIAFGAAAHVILFQPFLRHHDVSLAWYGLLLAPFRLGAAGAAVGAHILLRRFGFQGVFALFLAGQVGLLLLAAGIDHVVLLVAIGSVSIIGMARQPVVADYLNRRAEPEVRATVGALRRFSSSTIVALGAPIAGALGERSLQLAFLVLALATALTAVPSFILWVRAERAEAAARAPEATRPSEARPP